MQGLSGVHDLESKSQHALSCSPLSSWRTGQPLTVTQKCRTWAWMLHLPGYNLPDSVIVGACPLQQGYQCVMLAQHLTWNSRQLPHTAL